MSKKISTRYFAMTAEQAAQLSAVIADDVAGRSVIGDVWHDVPAAMRQEIMEHWAKALRKQVNAFARERMSKRQRGRAFEQPLVKRAAAPEMPIEFM